MGATRGILGAVLAGAGLLAVATALAQETGAPGGEKRGPEAVVRDSSGTAHRLSNARLFAESVGLLSVSLSAADAFEYKLGSAVAKVPFHRIGKIEFGGPEKGKWTQVTIADREGKTHAGVPNDPAKAEIRGEASDARFVELAIPLDKVTSIEFTWPPAKVKRCERCQRGYSTDEWLYCPYDAARLK
ncbi:MAG: hypothetical protein L0216_07010 [Planctomycetales bacterium]|nr:hypothetical protein [Planctomycetales bacterium]